MTYIVNDKCIKCKLTDCVDVCPVDCFYEGKNMLVIKPDECIDSGKHVIQITTEQMIRAKSPETPFNDFPIFEEDEEN